MFESLFGKKAEPKEVELRVTERGFEPARVRVARGQEATLVVTRVTERTCARELVMDEVGVHTPLPLGKAVRITFVPTKSGPMKFGCAMGKMVGGIVDVV